MSASSPTTEPPVLQLGDRRPLRVGLAALALALASFGVAVFLALQYFGPRALWSATQGSWSERPSTHLIVEQIPVAVALLIALGGALAWRQTRHPITPRRWSSAWVDAAKALAPLVLLPLTLLYHEVRGRQILAAIIMATVAYRAYPIVLGGRLRPGWLLRLSPGRLAGLIAALAAILYFVGAYLRHEALWSSLIDLGLFYELFDNPDGALLWSPTLGHSFLGEHFSPSLALLWPIMKLAPSPVTLLAIQAASVALGGWLLSRIALIRLQSSPLALAIMVAYLASPWVQSAVFYDFHMDMLEPPMLFGLVLALNRRRWGWVWVCALLLWLTKEDTFLYTAVIGLYAWRSLGHRRTGVALALIGLGWGIVALGWVMPALRPPFDPAHFATQNAETGYAFVARYSHLGDSPGDILMTLVTDPLHVLKHLTSSGVMSSILALLLSLAGLALAARWHLLLLLPTFEMLRANPGGMSHFSFYYGAVAMMLAVLVAIEGARRLRDHAPRWLGACSLPRLTLALLAMTAALLMWHPFSWLSSHHLYKPIVETPHHAIAKAIVKAVPEGSHVSATGYLAVHMQHGRAVSMFPFGRADADWVLVDRQRPPWPKRDSQVRSYLLSLASQGFVPVDIHAMTHGIFLLERRLDVPPGDRQAHRRALTDALDTPTIEAELSEHTAFMAGVETDPSASNGAFRRVDASNRAGAGYLQYGPYLALSPGDYRATFRLRWRPEGWGSSAPPSTVVATVDVTARRGRVRLAETRLTLTQTQEHAARWFTVTQDFTVKPGQADVELRVLYHDIGQLDLDVTRLERRP